jgi:6,7-dimethyl-8-ribityllumazine synthase
MSPPRVLEGAHRAQGLSVAIVAARFNDFVVSSLLKGALGAWQKHGGAEAELVVARVPGAFELPQAAQRFARTGRYHAVVALGCVIRGDTPHFDYVAGECARGLQLAALNTGVPVIFGVLTVETVDQAIERAALSGMNKGGEAMDTAVEMANLLAQV